MVIVVAIDSYNKKSIFTFLKYDSTESTKRSCSSHKTIREQNCFHFLQKKQLLVCDSTHATHAVVYKFVIILTVGMATILCVSDLPFYSVPEFVK